MNNGLEWNVPGEVMLSGRGEWQTLGLADKSMVTPSFRDDGVLEGRDSEHDK